MSTLPVTKVPPDTRHPMMRQLDLFSASRVEKSDDDGLDVSYLSKSFCMAGLPLRKLTERGNGGEECTEFHRRDDRFSLSINTTSLMLPGNGKRISVGLPFGPRARLLILWMTTSARNQRRDSGDRWLEIGKIDSWMEQLGTVSSHSHVQAVKDQLVRLSFAQFTMVLRKEGLDLFRSDKLIDSTIFQQEDLERYADGDLSRVRFPLGVELSENAFRRFSSDDVVPVSTEALRSVATSAMAIDILVYLHYRLPFIGQGESELVSWRRLAAQFGSNEPKSRFRQLFDGAIIKALEAYKGGANVDITDEGLILRYSPVDVRKLFAVNPTRKGDAPLLRVRRDTRVVTARIDIASVVAIKGKTA